LSRARLAVALALVVPLGFATKLTDAELVRGHLGGVLYVVFWILLVLLAWPGLRPGSVAVAVFLATCALEATQLWHPPWLESIRATFLGHALLGSTFSWWDFPCYAAGAGLGVGIASLCRRRN
jgi:hypothetical protein